MRTPLSTPLATAISKRYPHGNPILTRYLLEGQAFGPALFEETEGSTEVSVLPGLAIEWGFMATFPAP